LDENQNSNQQPRGIIPPEAKDTSAPMTLPASAREPTEVEVETSTASQPETQNSKPQTDAMEVHKHPHHVTHKKKWNEYLLEFLMLFLAVFLGFIAENIREDQAEKKRGEEYVKSFVEDLKKDTAQFRMLISEYTEADSATNQITSCYDTVNHHANSTVCLSTIISYLTGFTDYIYTDRTIQQLKNAGGLRLIQDKTVADSVISYDALVRGELIHQDVLENYQSSSIKAIQNEIDFASFHQLLKSQPNRVASPQLLKTDRLNVDELFNTLWTFKINLESQLAHVQRLKQKAEKLISFLESKS
jgi:hypothetical protein